MVQAKPAVKRPAGAKRYGGVPFIGGTHRCRRSGGGRRWASRRGRSIHPELAEFSVSSFIVKVIAR